jgi:hypothetical protein
MSAEAEIRGRHHIAVYRGEAWSIYTATSPRYYRVGEIDTLRVRVVLDALDTAFDDGHTTRNKASPRAQMPQSPGRTISRSSRRKRHDAGKPAQPLR